MSRPSLTVAAVLFTGAVSALSACSTGNNNTPTPQGLQTGPTIAQQGGVAAEPATASGPPSTQRVAAVRKQLLGSGDVTGFGAAGSKTYDYTVDRPCLKPTMLAAYPQHEELVSNLAASAGTFLSQHVIVFGDEPTARLAYAANLAEFGCPSGIVREDDEALPVTISVPAEVRGVLPGSNQATTYTLDAPGETHIVMVIAQVKDMVVDIAFSSDADKTAYADPLGAAKAAVAKLARAS